MKIFGKDIHRPLATAATLAALAVGALAVTAPAQARDSFGHSSGRGSMNAGASDHRGYRNDRHDQWDRGDHRGYWRSYDHAPRAYYYPPRYRYAPQAYYYSPWPDPYYYYGYY